MIIARAKIGGQEKYCVVKGVEFYPIEGDIYGEFSIGQTPVKTDGLLCPARPSKILALGVNYVSHAEEMKHQMPTAPIVFMKPVTALVGPGEKIVYPKKAGTVHYEAELAIVVGKKCRKVKRSQALEYVFGYTCANDVSERNFQKQDGQWTRAKGYDTFCPVGPYIVTDIDAGALEVKAVLNGETVQQGNTRDLINDVPAIVEWVSEIMTLCPGDLILTGTPKGVGEIKPGDEIEINIEKIGSLKNTVIAED